MNSLESLQDCQKLQPRLTPEMISHMERLKEIMANPVVEAAYNTAISNVDPFVEGGGPNPWIGRSAQYLQEYFRTWFTYLPSPSGGLGKIIPFSYFYLNNSSGYAFLNTLQSRSSPDRQYRPEIFEWVAQFVKIRGAFMDTEASAQVVAEWVEWLGPQIDDFVVPPGGFASFNAFFTRALNLSNNPRPVSDPEDESVVTAPADSVVNYIISNLTLTQALDVKSRQLNVRDLLNGSDLAQAFEGGTAVSCVLLPENYHRFHAPVTGNIVESAEVQGIYFGVTDGDDFLNNNNIGQGTTDFSVFEDFHRAYFVIETKNSGHVGVVPVGLNTISAITRTLTCGSSKLVAPGASPVPVTKGEELGYFAYGGSLVILLFQQGVFPSVSVLMGNRIGTLGSLSS